MVAIRVFISDPAHLVNDLSLGGVGTQTTRLLVCLELVRVLGREVLASQQEHLFVETADHRDFRLFLFLFILLRLLNLVLVLGLSRFSRLLGCSLFKLLLLGQLSLLLLLLLLLLRCGHS